MQRFVQVMSVMAVLAIAMPALAKPPKTSIRPHPRPLVEQVAPQPVQPIAEKPSAPSPVLAVAASRQVVSPAYSGPRPKRRPENVVPTLAVAASTLTVPSYTGPRPKARPAGLMATTKKGQAAPTAEVELASAAVPSPKAEETPEPEKKGLFSFLRPTKRPDVPKSSQKVAEKKEKKSVKGSVCGDPDIRGEALARIPSKVKGCGIEKPVRVTQIAGIRFSTPATINCDTAAAIKKWIGRAVEPTYGKGKVVQFEIAASYSCRPRNNKRGAKISEHGRGNAIDISGLTFSNGKSVTVLKNYDKTMRKIHKAACGIFGTTLGPGSDGYHENHLHFDVARYRNPYCR